MLLNGIFEFVSKEAMHAPILPERKPGKLVLGVASLLLLCAGGGFIFARGSAGYLQLPTSGLVSTLTAASLTKEDSGVVRKPHHLPAAAPGAYHLW